MKHREMEGGGGGKMGHDTKLLRGFSRTEPRKFAAGFVAGFLLVTFAYFSTAKFDTVHLAMVNSASASENAAAPSSQQLGLGLQNASMEGNRDENLPKNGAQFSPASEESTNTTQEEDLGLKNARNEAKFSTMAALPPPIREESTDTTENLGSKDVTAPKSNFSSPTDAVPAEQIPSPEIKQPEKRREGLKPAEWKAMCDFSNRRIDRCELEGDVRIVGKNSSIMLVPSPGSENPNWHSETWRIKPYPRKADNAAMAFVRQVTVRTLDASEDAPRCTDHHDVPALVFSDRGYTGNYFHAYTDVILPLFLTARQFDGEVQFLIADFRMWWVGKYLPIFKNLSRYDIIDLDNDDRVHCYPRAMIGLISHDDLGIDPAKSPNGYSITDFTKFLRSTYGLPRDVVAGIGAPPYRKPRLLIIARERTRRFVNLKNIIRSAEKLGFEVIGSEGQSDVAQFARIVNSCDAIMGVHGAGLTNIVYLPVRAAVIQIIPWGGLEWVAGAYFRVPSRHMKLHYLEYSISAGESTLVDRYPRNHTVFTDPAAIRAKGWNSLKEAFLDNQDVKLNMKRFRPVLKKALNLLRKNQ